MIVTAIAAGAALSLCALVRRVLEAGKGPASVLGGRVLVRTEDGRTTGYVVRPVERAGIYVPGGTAPLASTSIMTAAASVFLKVSS